MVALTINRLVMRDQWLRAILFLRNEVGQRLGRGAGDAGPTTTGVGHDRSWHGQAYQLLLFRMVSSA
jgi:hypothetical protein